MSRYFSPKSFLIVASIGLVGISSCPVVGASFNDEEVAFFKEEVRPLLEANCIKCHGGTDSKGKIKIRSGLQLISRLGITKGGEHGPAYDAENPEKSLLLKMISYSDDDYEMPPSGKLEADQIDTFTQWVKMGLPWTPEDADRLIEVVEEHDDRTKIGEYTKSHWSYKPLSRPEVPEIDDPEWAKNPLDAFVFAKLKEAGLAPNPEASAATLARRAYYNVTGLGPSPAELNKLSASEMNLDRWNDLVDELLASRHYGERWARHWLDTVRYAESNGFERDSEKEFIWRYRDYVIKALNEDVPYDRFIMEQLAGDELDEVTPDSLIATGYHRLMQWDDEPVDRMQHRYDVLDDNVRTTAETFLGMTLGCARCHDHKGDPILQKDYYSFMAFFHGVTQMDKRRVIQSIDSAMPREEMEKLVRWRQKQIAMREEEVGRFEKIALNGLMKLEPSLKDEPFLSTSASPVMLADSRQVPQEWSYTTEKPAEDWFTVGYRPKDWKSGKAPFGKHRKAKTQWGSSDIWLQKTFGLNVLPGGVKLAINHDEDVEVYLNGQLVFEAEGPITDYRKVGLDKDALSVLQTGRNVVSVHVKQTNGGQFIDLGLEGDYGGEKLAKLIRKHNKEIFTPVEWRNYRQAMKKLADVRASGNPEGMRAMLVQERSRQAEPMFVHVRGNANVKGDRVQPAFPAIFGGHTPKIAEPSSDSKTTRHRRVLAEWIASKENPRTARVMVNRVWQHHFGRGLCPTPNDFGFLGEGTIHPELLDWLACEFMERDWSIKELHRVIMSSKTYRMSSRGNQAALGKDPENRLYWRFDMRRLTAEEIRDSMLSVTGQINLAYGGPSFFPTLPPEVLATSSTGAGKWGRSSPEDERRRSVYMKIKRSLMSPELKDFDFADTDAPCAARFVTTVPTQALALLNSKVVNDFAAAFADRLEAEGGDTREAQLKHGLELICGRPGTAEELALCLKMADTFITVHQLDERQALERFCLMALNLNEFIYLD